MTTLTGQLKFLLIVMHPSCGIFCFEGTYPTGPGNSRWNHPLESTKTEGDKTSAPRFGFQASNDIGNLLLRAGCLTTRAS